MNELKPCPRCGAEAHVVTEDGEPTMFLCEECGYWLDVSEFETTEDAFKWWNDRPFIDALNARIAELEAHLAVEKDIRDALNARISEIVDLSNEAVAKLISRVDELEEENERLINAWFIDETIAPDGSLRPPVSKLIARIAELESFVAKLIEAGNELTMNPVVGNYEEREAAWTNLWLEWKAKESKK